MLKSFIAICAALTLFHPEASMAENASPAEQFRDAIYANDLEQAERLVIENQRLFEQRNRSSQDTRELFSVFASTHPKAAAFADRWLEKKPNSPFAHMAKARVLMIRSWNIRGELSARDTFPEALRLFSEMQSEAWAHANTAYESMPRLIAASEAVIGLSITRRQHRRGLEVFDAIMRQDPNPGSLKRGLELSSPGWGGSWEVAEYLCESYAEMVPDQIPSPVMSCKIKAAMDIHRNTKREWAYAKLKQSKFSHLEFYRLYQILLNNTYSPDESDAALAYRLLTEDEGNAGRMWHDSFDLRLGKKYGYDPISYDHFMQRYNWAREQVVHRPYDPEILTLLGTDISGWRKNELGEIEYKTVNIPTDEERVFYAKRMVIAHPYNADHWLKLQRAVMSTVKAPEYGAWLPYEISQLVYSNHSPRKLIEFLESRLREFEILTMVIGGNAPKSLEEQFANVEYERDIVCPIIRAKRLHDAQCKVIKSSGCIISNSISKNVVTIQQQAKEMNACVRERALPIYLQYFKEADIDLDALMRQ